MIIYFQVGVNDEEKNEKNSAWKYQRMFSEEESWDQRITKL